MKKGNGLSILTAVLGAALIAWFPFRDSLALASSGNSAPVPASLLPATAGNSSSGILRIYMIDVGQGEAALVIFPDKRTMLIDAGEREAAQSIIDFLDRREIKKLDFIVASHGHPDHTGGFSRLIKNGYVDSSTIAYSWSDRTWEGIRWRRVKPGDVIYDSADTTVTCYAARGQVLDGVFVEAGRNNNARSIVLNIKYRGFDYLAGGDLTGSGNHPNVEDPLGDALAARGIQVDVYKVHHHGSRFSSNLYFLQKIMPEFAMISMGDRNSFWHPTQAALDRLNDPSVHVMRIFQTEKGRGGTASNVTVAHGQIAISTDGASYSFSNEGPGSTVFSYGPYPVDEYVCLWPMFWHDAQDSGRTDVTGSQTEAMSWSYPVGGAGNSNSANSDSDN